MSRFLQKEKVAEGDALKNRCDFATKKMSPKARRLRIAVGDAILKERMTNDKRPGLVILTKLTNQHQFEILPEYGNVEIHFDLDNMPGH